MKRLRMTRRAALFVGLVLMTTTYAPALRAIESATTGMTEPGPHIEQVGQVQQGGKPDLSRLPTTPGVDLHAKNVEIDRSSFTTYPGVKLVLPGNINIKPFTVEEIKLLASTLKNARVVTVQGQTSVRVFRKGAWQLVPIKQYVDELNKVEYFLAGFGRTLRDGPFIGQPQKPVNKALGPILVLLPKGQKDSYKPEFADKKELFMVNPTLRSYLDFSSDHTLGEKVKLSKTPSYSMPGRPTMSLNRLRLQASAARKKLRLPQGNVPTGVRKQGVEAPCPCVKCPAPVTLGESAKCPICVEETGKPPCPASPCDGRGGPHVVNPGVICGEKNPQASSGCYKSCLYEGILGGSWTGYSDCTKATDGNGWFDADVCMEMNASACGANGAIDLRNSASLHLRATLFGLSFDLLDGNGETRFKTGWNNNQPAGTAAVTIPLLGDMAIPPLGYEQNFIGPSVIIPVGPIPVTIKSGLFAKLSLGAQQAAFDPWPAACGSSDSGSMGFQVGASAYASIWATASIDAIVAEAGIKAELVLANDSIGMGVKTAVTPAKNEVIIAPGFNYTLQHLAGRFSVFFDIDLLFYSKRYEYVFYEFAGFTTPPPGPTSGKIFAAIDPSKMTP